MDTKPIRISSMLLSVLSVLTITAFAEQNGDKGYPRGNELITVQELKGFIEAKDPKLVVLAAENSFEYLREYSRLAPDSSSGYRDTTRDAERRH